MISFLCLLGMVYSCGVSVHLSILSRVTSQLPSNITDRLQFARAGAFFPDAFYGCMDKSEAAEAAHWPPFLAEGARLVREKLKSGDQEGALNLYSFLYGVLSHQVADVTWHSLGINQGILDTMSQVEFGGDTDDAHSTLDAGGDFILLHRMFASGQDYSWIKKPWDYDSEAIILLLANLGYNVSKFQLNYCMSRGRAALAGEMQIADTAYVHYSQKSPLLYGNLEDYFIGGIAEMSSQTVECMAEFGTWLEAPPGDPWDICQVFDGKSPPKKRQTTPNRIRRGIHSAHAYFQIKSTEGPQFDKNTQVLEGSKNWSHFGKAVKWWKNVRLWIISSPQDGKVYFYNSDLTLNTTIQGPTKLRGLYHAQFGSSLEIVAANGVEYLASSSPGLSRVDFFTSNGTHAGGLVWKDAQRTFGQTGTKLVGTNLLFDAGSLYVAAPLSDSGAIRQSGQVFIIDTSTLERATKGKCIAIDPPQIAHEETEYGWFGSKLAWSNLFLLIGSPGTDTVYGYDRLTHTKLLTLNGNAKSGFGGHLLAAEGNRIAVGAPTNNEAGEQSGTVYFYEYTRRTKLNGDSGYKRFGHSGIFSDDKLFIGSPFAENERGVLWSHKLYTKSYEKLTNGPKPFSAGFCDTMISNGTHIVCTAPLYSNRGAAAFYPIEVES